MSVAKFKSYITGELILPFEGFEYGMWDYTNDKAILWSDPLFKNAQYLGEHCKVQTPKDARKHWVGMCWDTSFMLYDKAKSYSSFKSGVVFAVTGNSKNATSHTACVVNDPKTGVWFWLDLSWHAYRGANGPYGSKEELLEDLVRKLSGGKGNYELNHKVDTGKILKMLPAPQGEVFRVLTTNTTGGRL